MNYGRKRPDTNSNAIALVTVIIFVGLIVLVSLMLFSLITSQIRLTNHHVNRAKAFYATEAAMVECTERLRLGQSPPAYVNIPWYFLSGAINPDGGNITVIYNNASITDRPYESIPIQLVIEDYDK